MPSLLIVGKDLLCCTLAERIVADVLPGWTLSAPPINTGGITRLRTSLHRYAEQARHGQPVFCLADTDGQCAVDWLQQWSPRKLPAALVLRLAVNEAESWVLADRIQFARSMHVPLGKIPPNVDQLSDPKGLLLRLVGRSRKRLFRTEMISATDPLKQGTGYNLHLCEFVRTRWNASSARQLSPSLGRAIRSLQLLIDDADRPSS